MISSRTGIVAGFGGFLLVPILLIQATDWTPQPAACTAPPCAMAVDAARGWAWAASFALLLAAMVAMSAYLKGTPLGLLIDRRNRFSLSRFQVVVWTVLVIPTLYVALMANVLRHWGEPGLLPVLDVDWTMVALMGISVGSFLAAPLALSVKSGQPAAPADVDRSIAETASKESKSPDRYTVEGKLLTRGSPEDASLLDLFLGEEVGNARTLDLARLQMLAITMIVWLVYAAHLGQTMILVDAESYILSALPRFDETLLTLILVSHGGYLAGKVVPNSMPVREQANRSMAALNAIGMRAAALKSAIETFLQSGAPTPWVESVCRQYAFEAGKIGADAQALNSRLAAGESVDAGTARLDGRLDALEASFHLARSQTTAPAAEVPPPSLVRTIMKGLSVRGFLGDSGPETGDWDASAEKALEAFLKAEGVLKKALPEPLNDRLEAVASLLD